MSDKPRLLVVDDEAVICQACRRIFSRQGFDVDESTNAREGLSRAKEENHAGILLDIKMPEMDGIRFLEDLRKDKPDLPVLIMTGYPSVPNAAAAVRLGASDYITKPFTPEDITQSVQRMLRRGLREPIALVSAPPATEAAEAEGPPKGQGQLLFLDEAWLRLEEDGSACVGAVLPRAQGAAVKAVRLPGIGEVVYQGLPLAGVTMADRSPGTVLSPISGVVVAVNELLNGTPSALLNDPCGAGWIACVCTTRLEDEIAKCQPRRVILANADESSGQQQREQLTSLGCQVEVASDWDTLALAMQAPDCTAIVFDADSFGEAGPELVGCVNATMPSTKVVVVASSETRWEAAYRQKRIFYYAVEPFADNEVLEILDALFRPHDRPGPRAEHRGARLEPIGEIRVTNRNGHKVHLLASPGLPQERGGLGWRIKQKLAERMLPIVTSSGEADVSPTNIVKTARASERVMVLTAKDAGRLPGSLARDTKAEFGSVAGEKTSRVTALEVQPDPSGAGFLGLDDRTTNALAEHIVKEMASY